MTWELEDTEEAIPFRPRRRRPPGPVTQHEFNRNISDAIIGALVEHQGKHHTHPRPDPDEPTGEAKVIRDAWYDAIAKSQFQSDEDVYEWIERKRAYYSVKQPLDPGRFISGTKLMLILKKYVDCAFGTLPCLRRVGNVW